MPVAITETSAVFTAAVTLEQAEPEHFDLAFTADTQPCPWPKAYGGDLVAAAAAAAMRSVTDGKTYCYATTAVDPNGESAYSNLTQAVIPAP